MGKKELEFEQRITSEQTADFLEELAKGFRSGTIELSSGDKLVRLSPTYIVKTDLEVSVDDDKQEISLELKWRVPELPTVATEPQIGVASTPTPTAPPISDIS